MPQARQRQQQNQDIRAGIQAALRDEGLVHVQAPVGLKRNNGVPEGVNGPADEDIRHERPGAVDQDDGGDDVDGDADVALVEEAEVEEEKGDFDKEDGKVAGDVDGVEEL